MWFAVIGSRGWYYPERVRTVIDEIAILFPGSTIVTGGARGPDTWAEDRARFIGLAVDVIRPMGPSQGALRARNRIIIAKADLVIAFWDGFSDGTRNALEVARELGKPVWIPTPA